MTTACWYTFRYRISQRFDCKLSVVTERPRIREGISFVFVDCESVLSDRRRVVYSRFLSPCIFHWRKRWKHREGDEGRAGKQLKGRNVLKASISFDESVTLEMILRWIDFLKRFYSRTNKFSMGLLQQTVCRRWKLKAFNLWENIIVQPTLKEKFSFEDELRKLFLLAARVLLSHIYNKTLLFIHLFEKLQTWCHCGIHEQKPAHQMNARARKLSKLFIFSLLM